MELFGHIARLMTHGHKYYHSGRNGSNGGAATEPKDLLRIEPQMV